MAKNEKTFLEFMPFDSKEATAKLAEKKAAEFPQLTTAKGKATLRRLIKWQSVTYKDRTFDVPVVAAICDDKECQITLASLFGKEKNFICDRESCGYKKGESITINNLVVWSPELQSSPTLRNEAVMAAITEGMEIELVTVWGHYEDSESKRSSLLTFVKP